MPIGNWLLDIFIVLFLAAGFYFGWKRGFIRIALKSFAGLFSAVFALSLFDSFGVLLKNKYVFSFVHTSISKALDGTVVGEDAATLAEAVPEGLQKIASLVGIDLVSVAEGAIGSGQDAVAEFATGASHAIAQFISSVAAFLILFLLSSFVLRVLSAPISAVIMKIPLLGHVNRLLGLLFGALAALILAWLFVKLVGFFDVTFDLSFVEVEKGWAAGPFYRFSLLS